MQAIPFTHMIPTGEEKNELKVSIQSDYFKKAQIGSIRLQILVFFLLHCLEISSREKEKKKLKRNNLKG